MGFTEPCFAESDDEIAAQAFPKRGATASYDWEQVKQKGWQRLDVPERYAPFAQGGFPRHPESASFIPRNWSDSARIRSLLTSRLMRVQAACRTGAPLPAGDDFAAGAQFPQFIVRECAKPARCGGERRSRSIPSTRGARDRRRRSRARVQRSRRDRPCRARSRIGRGPESWSGLSIWWKKFARDGKNANELTNQRLTDIGRGPTFYDCLVQATQR